MPKRLGRAAVLLLVLLLLAACGPINFQNTNELLRAPALGPGQEEIQKALAAHLKGEPQYKFPREGEWRSPLVRVDLDGDGTDEAVLFYTLVGSSTPSQGRSNNVYMALLRQAGNAWQVITELDSGATDIASIETADLFGDGTKQLLVGYSNAAFTAKTLTMYQFAENQLGTFTLGSPGREFYLTYCLADFKQNGNQQVAIISTVPGEDTAGPRLDIFEEGTEAKGVLKIAQTLDLYVNFDVARPFYMYPSVNGEGQPLLLIDGFTAGKDGGLLTSQLLDYSNDSFYVRREPEEFALASLRESSLLQARDIDANGIIEIPREYAPPGSGTSIETESADKQLRYVQWVDFTGEEAAVKQFGLLDIDRNIYVRLPDEWRDNIRVADGLQSGEWVIENADTGQVLLSLRALREEEVPTEDMKRVPGDISTYLVPSPWITGVQRNYIKGVLLS